jgi:hypothetical protein
VPDLPPFEPRHVRDRTDDVARLDAVDVADLDAERLGVGLREALAGFL